MNVFRRYRATVRAVKRGAATNLRPSYTTLFSPASVTFTIGDIDVHLHEGRSVHWYRRPNDDCIEGCALWSWRLRRALRRHMPNASEFPEALGGPRERDRSVAALESAAPVGGEPL